MNEEDQQQQSGKESSYPVFDLQTCLEFASAVRELGGSKSPVKKSILAKHVGLAESTPSFFQKLSASKAWGIIDGWGSYQLSELGRTYFYPTSEDAKSRAGLAFLKKPTIFDHLANRFDGDKLPPNNVLGNILHQEFAIPDSWKDRLAGIFVRSAQYLGIIDSVGILRYDASMHEKTVERKVLVETIPDVPDAKERSGDALETPAEGRAVWHFPYKGSYVRLDTPENIAPELCGKLNAYVQVIKPIE